MPNWCCQDGTHLGSKPLELLEWQAPLGLRKSLALQAVQRSHRERLVLCNLRGSEQRKAMCCWLGLRTAMLESRHRRQGC